MQSDFYNHNILYIPALVEIDNEDLFELPFALPLISFDNGVAAFPCADRQKVKSYTHAQSYIRTHHYFVIMCSCMHMVIYTNLVSF